MHSHIRKYIYLSLFSFSLTTYTKTVSAQEMGVKVNFFGFADNREFGASNTMAKTIFGTTLSPQLYVTLEDKHKLVGGLHYNQDFGKHRGDKDQLNLIAYYDYQNKNIDFAIGLIPRYSKLNNVPRLVLADTFMYDRPNIEGLYFKVKNENSYQAIYIDWLSQQSETQREQFLIGITGRYRWGNIYFNNDGLLFHNATTSSIITDEHIQDNAVIMGNLGLDLSEKTFLDSLTIDVGAAAGFDRHRKQDQELNTGFINNVHMAYSGFFIQNTLYIGKPLSLPNGDPFYKRARYDRLDLGWRPFKTKKIEGKLTVSFHIRKGGIDNQQAFTLRYNFAQAVWKKVGS